MSVFDQLEVGEDGIVVRRPYAERLVAHNAGAPHAPVRPNVTIDLIFRSEGRIEMGAEILQHACAKPFDGLTLRVPSVEDMAIHYPLMDTDERQGHWYDAMRYLRRIEDWDYLAQRARALGPGKTLAALLYAADIGIDVPRTSIHALASSCFG